MGSGVQAVKGNRISPIHREGLWVSRGCSVGGGLSHNLQLERSEHLMVSRSRVLFSFAVKFFNGSYFAE